MTPPTSLEAPASTANRRVVAFHELPSPEAVMNTLPLSPEMVTEVETSAWISPGLSPVRTIASS